MRPALSVPLMQPGDGIGESSFAAGMLDMPPAPALADIDAGVADAPAADDIIAGVAFDIAAIGGEATPPVPTVLAIVALAPAVGAAALLPALLGGMPAIVVLTGIAAVVVGGALTGAALLLPLPPPQAANAKIRPSFPAATSGARRMDHSSLR